MSINQSFQQKYGAAEEDKSIPYGPVRLPWDEKNKAWVEVGGKATIKTKTEALRYLKRLQAEYFQPETIIKGVRC